MQIYLRIILIATLCFSTLSQARSLQEEIKDLKETAADLVRSRSALCWLPLIFPKTKERLEKGALTLQSLIKEKEKLLRDANSIPARLSGVQVMVEDFGVFYAYTPYTGSWTNQQQKVQFQTRATINFSWIAVPEKAALFMGFLTLSATQPVARGAANVAERRAMNFSPPEERQEGGKTVIAFRSNLIDVITLGDWFSSNQSALGKFHLEIIADPSQRDRIEVRILDEASRVLHSTGAKIQTI